MGAKSEQLQIRVTPREKAAVKKLAAAAGQDVSSYVLARLLPPARGRFGALLKLLREEEDRRYVLAELHDLLAGLARAELEQAVAGADLASLDSWLQNYVAAMVEQACARSGVQPPAWTSRVVALERPYFAAPLRSLRPHLLRAAPVVFKRRNLFVDATIGARV
jgi:uncharacterized protein (DUF1778 family)